MQPKILSAQELVRLGLDENTLSSVLQYNGANDTPTIFNIIYSYSVNDICNILWTMIQTYGLDIHLNNDIALAYGLLRKNFPIVKYLVELGCDPKKCLEEHGLTLFKSVSEGINQYMIEYFMSKELDISWLYTMPNAYLHFAQYIRQIDRSSGDDFLTQVINYLSLRGILPDKRSIVMLVRLDYDDILSDIVEIDPSLDLIMCMAYALESRSLRIIKKLFSLGVQIDEVYLSDYLNEDPSLADLIELLYENDYTPSQVVKILKYI